MMMVSVAGPVSSTPMSEERRAQRLQEVVMLEQGRGANLINSASLEAVMSSGRRVNHVLHLILSILTLGTWALLVWLPLSLFGGEKRYTLRVDEYGCVRRS